MITPCVLARAAKRESNNSKTVNSAHVNDRPARRLLITDRPMFAFYSNRVGCLGSIAVSLIGSLIFLAALWAFNAR